MIRSLNRHSLGVNNRKGCERKKPRNGIYADEPGSYNLVVRSSRQLADPGEDLRIDIFITGYGNILAAKFGAYPDYLSIDEQESRITFGLREYDDKIYFGGSDSLVGKDGVTIELTKSGIQYGEWDQPTLFFDCSEGATPPVITESIQHSPDGKSNAPITLDLQLDKKARPGNHSMNFVLTYFNGSVWCSSKVEYQFVVRSFYQRHEITILFVGFVITVIGLITVFL